MDYEKPLIEPIGSGGGGGDIKPQGCTWLAIVFAVAIAAAGAYVGVGYAYAAGAAVGVWAAAFYSTVGTGCSAK